MNDYLRTSFGCLVAAGVLLASGFSPGARSHARRDPGRDPMFSITGSTNAWSVSSSEAGCYLISPWRYQTSRLALGLHPKLGLGLYAVGFAMAVPSKSRSVPVIIRTEVGEVGKVGTLVSPDFFFVPLTLDELSADLTEISRSGALWVSIQDTWISHAGRSDSDTADSYRKKCAAWVQLPAGTVARDSYGQ